MSTGEDEPSSGLNGRLRPRKSGPSPQTTKAFRKLDSKPTQDKPKRIATPSKASPNKSDDLTVTEEIISKIICAFCDETFFSKQAFSKHVRRVHLSSTHDNIFNCLFCNHTEIEADDIIRHMTNNHPNQYFACSDCHTRFLSTAELAEHKLNVCEKPKLPYRNKLRQKATPKKNLKALNIQEDHLDHTDKNFSSHNFNGIVISCELKSSHPSDSIDIEDSITTNLILPPNKNLNNPNVIEKNAVIVLDDLQFNKRIPHNFSFHNTDADQILSRLGVVHRSPRTGDSNKKDWLKHMDDPNQKFEKCFDTSFYSKVASNVQENLMKFLDGSFNFNPDPENTIKTRKAKNCVAINTAEGFPILLAAEQFCRNVLDGYMPRTIAPKHKWKWDNLESDKNLMSPEQIKRDSHANNCIISLVSSLDIWTQLCMRRKFEESNSKSSTEKRIDKQSIIGKELKEILESRELPTSSSQVVKYKSPSVQARDSSDFPSFLGLVPSTPNHDLKPAVLSGEWVRPRCYVCCACGAQSRDSKAVSSHISTQHPNAQIQHYEIVGEVLLNSDILKHLYVPPSQLNNRTRPLRGIRECTKCQKSISLEDLHQHMLDCAGDTPAVRRKCRYRPFGVRKRRARLPDNIRQEMRQDPTHMRRHNQKTHMRPRPKIRTEVGDADTIRKMLADLPAKRHRVIINPVNTILRPRKKLSQRKKMIIKKRAVEDMKRKAQSSDTPQDSPLQNDDTKKSLCEAEKMAQAANHSVKRVAAKVLGQRSVNKKNPVSKGRRKACTRTKTEEKIASDLPTKGNHELQINQLSTEQNSQRMNVNDNNNSINTREQSNQDGSHHSNSRSQSPSSSRQNNSSRDFVSSSQHAPLKHSIASLTANSETHDKSVQFHRMFLVQQECNDTTQHLPSGQTTYFESEAVITKLDKPPLDFDQQEALDASFFQKNKLNKPRKGLNDCIEMLKNKLVDPNMDISIDSGHVLTEHVSVQCGSDEPIDPEPVITERRLSTTESNIESGQRASQVFYPDKPLEDTQSFDNRPENSRRVTRRSTKRHGKDTRREKIVDVQPQDDYMYWNQFYYNKQLTSTNKSHRYNKREYARRRSNVSQEDLLLQQAISYEMLANTNRNMNDYNDYQFPHISTPQKSSKKSRQDSHKTRSNGSNRVTKPKNKAPAKPRQRKTSNTINSQRNCHSKLPERKQSLQITDMANNANVEQHTLNLATTSENVAHYYVQGIGLEDNSITDYNKEQSLVLRNSSLQDQMCPLVYPNMPLIPYIPECNIVPVHYDIHQDARGTSEPLDLSNIASVAENSLHYNVRQESYSALPYNTCGTLDLSTKTVNIVSPERDSCLTSEEVVDLRVINHSKPVSCRSSTLTTEFNSDRLEDNATDLSYKSVASEDNLPTDLSMKRKDVLGHTYEKRVTFDNSLEVDIIHDLSRPIRHKPDMLIASPQEENLNIEEPTDLSIKQTQSRTNVTAGSIFDEQILNIYRSQPDYNEQYAPADLSNKNIEIMRNSYYRNEPRRLMYPEIVVSNNDGISIDNCLDLSLSRKIVASEQIINAQYNVTREITLQMNPLESRTAIDFSEPVFKGTRNVVSSDESSVSNLPADINCTSINQSGPSNDLSYMITEMPLSLCTRSDMISVSNASSFRNDDHKTRTTGYSLSGYQESLNSDNVHTNDIIDATATYSTFEPPETVSVHRSSISSVIRKSNRNLEKRKLSSESENLDAKKYIQIDESSNHMCNLKSLVKDTNTIKANHNQNHMDQDTETAKKIAMLPKELVEILGTMPIDHRNQLLNVLPQYVSTTSSPVLLSNTDNFRRDSISSSTLSSQNDYKKGYMSDDNRILHYPTSSPMIEPAPITISSSVLLTPPTPQLPDRQSSQANENEEIQASDYRTKSLSIDEQPSLRKINSDNLKIKSHTNLLNRIATTHENAEEDRVIDLTSDETAPETSEVVQHMEPSTTIINNISKDRLMSPITSLKSNLLKNTNDKTASLRAVRIKTTSERQRSIIAENTMLKKLPDSAVNIIQQELQNKSPDNATSKAIQQAEVSSTQHRSVTRISPSTPVQVETCSEISSINKKDEFLEKKSRKSNDTERDNVLDKQNVVSSSITKEKKSYSKDVIICQKSNSSKVCQPFNGSNVTSVEKADLSLSAVMKNPIDFSEDMEMEVNERESTTLPMEEDDSEDDVSLAVIVKQKQQDINATVHENKATPERVKMKEVKDFKQMTCDKIAFEENNKTILSSNRKSSNVVDSSIIDRPKPNTETSNDTNKSGICANEEQEKVPHLKKKGRRGRRINVLGTKNAEQESSLCNASETSCENEIDKENNISEIVKNVEVIEDSIKTKQIEQETNRPTSNSQVINNNKEVGFNTCLPIDIEKNILNGSLKCDTSVNANTSEQSGNNIKENETLKNNLKADSKKCKLRSPNDELSSIASHTYIPPEENAAYVAKDDDNRFNPQKDGKVVKFQVVDVKDQAKVNISKQSKNNNSKHDDKGIDKKGVAELEEANIVPVRRSRRGKSLFIDSNSTTNDMGYNIEHSTEHRAPLTKKEIIFSKLLQDEENYNKPVVSTTKDKQVAESSSNKPNDLQEDMNSMEHGEEQNTDKIKANKRKKSPQSKNKCKKQRSLPNTKVEEKFVETKLTDTKTIKETKIMVSDDSISDPVPSSDILNTQQVFVEHTTNDDVCTEVHNSDNVKKSSILIEKRKSSPDGSELPSLIKKSKLNDEIAVTCNKITKINDKEIDADQNKFVSSASATLRNITCYNKATRRARSKSVVVKSSKNELYDPYDIDLEEMADKTEPFERKEISPKISFNTFKSTIAAKSRKSSKTLPVTNVDVISLNISPPIKSAQTDLVTKSYIPSEKNKNINLNDGFSDSDESSKSDVPLKIIVEEKERKLMKISSAEEKPNNVLPNTVSVTKFHETLKRRKKDTQSQSEYRYEKELSKTENEDELRSEQFMESFGFFSERKPRKSNLLASKKISETFNLIEDDEIYFASKERVPKKSINEKKEEETKIKPPSLPVKKIRKRGRKKKKRVKIKPSFCHICKRAFRRFDNYLRHLESLYHVSKFCEIELKIKTRLVEEEPNYLLVYRQQLNRLKVLQNKIAKRKKNCLSTADIVLPTLEQILDDVKRTVREQIKRRKLSRDEALFVDCCEMLKSQNSNNRMLKSQVRQCNSYNCAQACQEELAMLEQSILDDRCDIKDDDDMDSVTAKKIMESEEVRNLENDLISNLKEANGLKGPLSSVDAHIILSNYESIEERPGTDRRRHPETKDKLYPDVPENIDMFEDKFDKIKRKCRSQAAAAKQMQTNIELNSRHKNRRKSEKRKAKRNFRKTPNTVPTKAALKGFDGIKVSILTSDINLSSIVPSVEKTHKKKKKRSSKKKRNRKLSEKSSCSEKSNNSGQSNRIEENYCTKELPNKKVDVYEFMDDDSEILELRPTVIDRFKSSNNKDLPTTSKSVKDNDMAEITSESGSDGDDFVYMSDDYVCSDDETENSMLSCELGTEKGIGDRKKTLSPMKRKEAAEKSALMGKIFKHNAVRSDRRSPKMRELSKPKANLDQLFDSLLEDEPRTSAVAKTNDCEKEAACSSSQISPCTLHENDAPREHELPPPVLEKHHTTSSKKVTPSKDALLPPSRVYLSLSPQKATDNCGLSPPSRVYLSLSPQKDDQARHDKKIGRRFDQGIPVTTETGLTQKYSTPSPTLHPSLASFATRRSSTTPPRKTEVNNLKEILISEISTSKQSDNKQKFEASIGHDHLRDKHAKNKESLISAKDDIFEQKFNASRGHDRIKDKHRRKNESSIAATDETFEKKLDVSKGHDRIRDKHTRKNESLVAATDDNFEQTSERSKGYDRIRDKHTKKNESSIATTDDTFEQKLETLKGYDPIGSKHTKKNESSIAAADDTLEQASEKSKEYDRIRDRHTKKNESSITDTEDILKQKLDASKGHGRIRDKHINKNDPSISLTEETFDEKLEVLKGHDRIKDKHSKKNESAFSAIDDIFEQKLDASKGYDRLKDKHIKKNESLLQAKEDILLKPEDTNCCIDDYYEKQKSKDKVYKDKTEKKKKEKGESNKCELTTESFDWSTCDDTGVARQRARRKCTVGKQNVLAETWSSESEPDGAPPRPNSAESVMASNGRKKRGRKKNGLSGNRKTHKLVSTKKQDNESRVGGGSRGMTGGPPARPHYWSEGEEEQEHPQQHGWIVGDSHKKLVTMLAHAKGRKRSAEEKRNLLE